MRPLVTSRTGDLRRAHRRTAGDLGSTSLELVVLFPVLLALVFGLVQGSLWYHARGVAAAAAREGVRVARAEGGSLEQARQRAGAFVDRAGGADVLGGALVTATADYQRVRVVVSGRSATLLPGTAGLQVTEMASGPVERFTSRGTR